MHSENLITMKKSLIALAFGTLGLGIAEFVMMGILPDVAKALNISIATAGHLISAYAIGVCVGAPLLIIARKYPLKNILLVLVSMIMLGNIIAASAPNYWILMLGRFISGLPHGAYFGVGSIVAEKLADKGKGSEAVSIMIAGMTVANLFGVPLGTSLSAAISWRMTFLLVGVWGVLILYYIWRWVPQVEKLPDTGFKGQFRFLKWAGGKGQLLSEIEKYYPFADGKITKYAEPFVGGGAVLFDILSKYDLDEVYISDINAELANTYLIIRDNIDKLIAMLTVMQNEFVPTDTELRKAYYLTKRERFNDLKVNGDETINIEKAALMIFLNKTCFNGLFRVNKKGLFNVPMGSYKNPMICDEDNLCAVSEKLQNVTIVCGDYRKSADFIDENTFVYFDPPYRPITDTASFTAYTENLFNDEEQIELARFIDDMHQRGAKMVISNSDPKNSNTEDDFFDNIYSSHRIKRVEATRMINCNSKARGKIKELLISNF